MVEEVYYAIKGHSLQIRREGDDANMISSKRGARCPKMATKHNLLKIIGDIEVYTDFKMLKVKVPIIFFGTPVFSARMDRC